MSSEADDSHRLTAPPAFLLLVENSLVLTPVLMLAMGSILVQYYARPGAC